MHSEVMNHLYYYKALLDEELDIDYYIDIARGMEEGVHISAKNPVDKAVSIVFELVMKEKLDPWRIDLVKFVEMYMNRIKSENEIDFVIAGKIIYMAWNILMRKSEDVLNEIERDELVFGDIFEIDPEPFVNYYEDSYVDTLPEDIIEQDVIKEPVRREEKRPVSLMELLQAINQARVEIETKKRQRKIREKFKFNLEEKVHKEDLEEEIKEVWSRLCEVHGDEVYLSLVYDGTREDFIKVFLSLLFLEKFGKVTLEQYAPYDDIVIKILVPEEMRLIESLTPPEIIVEEIT